MRRCARKNLHTCVNLLFYRFRGEGDQFFRVVFGRGFIAGDFVAFGAAVENNVAAVFDS